MSTRCNVCVKLHKEDLNKELKVDDTHYVSTKTEYPYMEIYIHHNGHVNGVGKSLYKDLLDYNQVKQYILQGDRTSFDTLYTECGEKYESNKPNFLANIDGSIPEEYYYIFDEDNEWYWKDNKSNGPWKLLKDEFPEIRDQRSQDAVNTTKVFKQSIGFEMGGFVKAMTPEESYEWHKKHARIDPKTGNMIISDNEIGDGSFERKYTKLV